MKKLTLILLSILMIVTLAACGDKCEHTYDNACDAICNDCEETREVSAHQWKDATCTTLKTCTVCGTTEGEMLPHNWEDATCITAKTCKTCGATEGETLGHTPAEDDGDCTTPVTCSLCDAEMSEANGAHNLVYELEAASENATIFKSRCADCQDASKSATTTIIIGHGSVTLTELKGKYNDTVFLFADSHEAYKTYRYIVDAGENEDAHISVYFYADETCDGFFSSNSGYTLLEGEAFMDLNNRFIGIKVDNYSNEPVTITFSLEPQV